MPSSPIGYSSGLPTPSMFKKKRSPSSQSSGMTSAASYLAAVAQADARARVLKGSPPTSTPALSFSSSATGSTEDSILREFDSEADGPLCFSRVPPNSEQVFSTVHSEFGHCANEEYRHTSAHTPGKDVALHVENEPPYYIVITTYFSYLILICLGHMRDFFGKRFYTSHYKHLLPHDGYAPLNSDFDSFYTRRLKTRMDDCFSAPTTGVPGRTVMLLDRVSDDYNRTFKLTGTRTRGLNISSYNYLGFAQARGGCADAVEDGIKRYGVVVGGARREGGTSELHIQAEALVARFVGQEDALISSMGFATNSTIIPALVSKGCLVISDELNHASIRVGVRMSGANVRTYKHNDMKHLENILREAISQGQTKTHRPWKKILIIVEGLFSMEGTVVNLPALLELKKRYKFYLFVDEAHSIGALGPHGRGVADYFNIPPKSIDIHMGTFTKSFGAAGGYIAGNKSLIDRLRLRGHGGTYAESMSPPVIIQIIASMASIMGVSAAPITSKHSPSSSGSSTSTVHPTLEQHPGLAPAAALPAWMNLPAALRDGSEGLSRLRRLNFNSRYLARGLNKLGMITYGICDSPVVPLLLFNPGKMAAFHRFMHTRKVPIVIVVVTYPATPLMTCRVRFCVSASHTKDDIDIVLEACDQAGDIFDLKHYPGERWSMQKIKDNAVELVNMEEI